MVSTDLATIAFGTNAFNTLANNEVYRNYKRNKLMIDLADIPEAVKSDIINTYEKSKPAHQSKILNYLIKKRCKMLIECIEDFT